MNTKWIYYVLLMTTFVSGMQSTNNNGNLIMAIKTKKPSEVLNMIKSDRYDVNVRDDQGETPLHWAVFPAKKQKDTNEKVKLIEPLLHKGANLDAQDTLDATPLFWAAEWGNVRAAQLLLKHNARIDLAGQPAFIFSKEKKFFTPLELLTLIEKVSRDPDSKLDIEFTQAHKKIKTLIERKQHLLAKKK